MLPDRYFSPDSIFWRVNREGLMLFTGPRALLLEIAHPLVAAGVAEHSDFRRRPFSRLFRTVGVMTALNFEPYSRADSAVGHTRRSHGRVRGRLAEDVGPFLAGTPYSAEDPLLQLWVLATLVDSVLAGYQLLVRPLSRDERQAYYAGAHGLARAFGLPPGMMPPTYDDFETYVDSMINSDQLTVGPAAREIAHALLHLPVIGPAVRLGSFASIGLLPPRLRAEFGFRWTPHHERRLQRLARISRRLRPLVPDPLCVHPQALLAEWRLRRSGTALA
jgi:uncharacterized protein (DUF2236 family)